LSKASFLKTSFDRKAVAIAKFKEFEQRCHDTNIRFKNPSSDPLNNGSNVWLLNATKRKIAEILGEYSGEELVDGANWGPGVSTLIKGEEVSAFNKFHAERGITRDLYSLVAPWFKEAYPAWHRNLSHLYGENYFVEQVGNAIITVPKSSKTDRVIAVEPGINLWFQKSVGSMIRRRLRRVGMELSTQEVNQKLSAQGSKYPWDLATVDFSSASDSISSEVVRELLPPRWFQLLDLLRCRIGKLGDEIVRWNKFSSMGNGFTFELESLIFYCAALACVEYQGLKDGAPLPKTVSVHGDDVILPSPAFDLFSQFSEFLGFKVNPKKSFSEGYFRESCGAHWYDGVDCKPIFLKERSRNVEAIYKLANSIRNLAHRYHFMRSCDSRFRDAWTHLLLRVPEPLRLFVPREAGDVGFVGNFDEACPTRARYGIEGYYYRALTTTGVSRESEEPAMLLARLWVPSVDIEGNNSYPLRGRTRRTVTTNRTPVRQWYDYGPWWD